MSVSDPVPEPAPLVFVPADGAVRDAVTKVGGQPVWLGEPQWPLSRGTGQPMEFLGQFAVAGGRLAYLFMTGDGHDSVDGTFDPEGGENALVVQPDGRVPDFVTVEHRAEGPSAGADHLPGAADTEGDGGDGTGGERTEGEGAEGEGGEGEGDGESRRPWQYLGGPGVEPHWLQGEEPPGDGWSLVVQLDSGKLPFDVDFGDSGVGYAFLSPDAKEGRFLWQCM
ncbi:hypothetical protein [Streptomyces pseudovenezuelae]|uniref:DUF1963 domain-containing protein n=1 Tax=Streptomyces pseudovenezuelae TaxID=67350 RepID=A0ABT6LUF5_9ACTN|nr:hypothetical protein [Streptomyces pseudovenezuelae]MDH6219950.1 hypothetical protein [Streptomyces pseudovenezuelae]